MRNLFIIQEEHVVKVRGSCCQFMKCMLRRPVSSASGTCWKARGSVASTRGACCKSKRELLSVYEVHVEKARFKRKRYMLESKGICCKSKRDLLQAQNVFCKSEIWELLQIQEVYVAKAQIQEVPVESAKWTCPSCKIYLL